MMLHSKINFQTPCSELRLFLLFPVLRFLVFGLAASEEHGLEVGIALLGWRFRVAILRHPEKLRRYLNSRVCSWMSYWRI
jgi:hypothetical protein